VNPPFRSTAGGRFWIGRFRPVPFAAFPMEYARCDLQGEGVARGSAFFYGVHRDQLVMAVLRPEWEANAGSN
jgi:diamine N-acetyltransferase